MPFNPKSLDLDECESPEHVAVVLRNAAEKFNSDAGELQAAWQDRGAGAPWLKIARKLNQLADKLP